MSTIKVNRIENTASSSGGINIDASGRVGVDATPEAWSGFSALEVNEASIVSSGSGDAFFTANAYYDGAWKYKDAGVARNVYMNADGIVFRTAPSGSADGAITWTEVGRWREGGGLCFNGDTAAANALDDYEEGTWDPQFANSSKSTDNISAQPTGRHGSYTKIGDRVFFNCWINGDLTTTETTSAIRIINLPFDAASGGDGYSALSIWNYGGFSTYKDELYARNQNGDDQIVLQRYGADLNFNDIVKSNINIMISGHYHV